MKGEVTAGMGRPGLRTAAVLWQKWARVAEAKALQKGLEREASYNSGLAVAYRECAAVLIHYLDNLQ